MPPRVLLAATACWVATARLAEAFAGAGCRVEVVCPRRHPVKTTPAVSRLHRYRVFAPLRSVDLAIRAARPDLIIPCDDLARAHLARLHERASREGDSATRAQLEESLGDASSMAVATARSDLIAVARELGIRAPATAVARTPEALRRWFVDQPGPLVLKTNGSCGGGGVRIVHSADEAERAWRLLGSPPSLRRAITRSIVNRDLTDIIPWLRRTRPTVNVQAFVSGRDANCTIACWQGAILASITALVVETVTPLGPASVVRLIEHPEISAAAGAIVRRLSLSGLIGLDFILEDGTGRAHLIEMNPRAPQICHLRLGAGRDLTGSLRAALTGEPPQGTPPTTENDVIALFPQEWLRDSGSVFLKTAYHDVPWHEPDLVSACVDEMVAQRIWAGVARRARATRARLLARRPNASAGARGVAEPA